MEEIEEQLLSAIISISEAQDFIESFIDESIKLCEWISKIEENNG